MIKKIPERRCTGCGISRPKKELIRIVKSANGNVFCDLTGKASGRGAYICRDPQCLKKAVKQKRLERSLDCVIPDEVYAALEKELCENV